MNRKIFIITAFLILCFFTDTAQGYNLQSKRYILPNGLTIIFVEKHSVPIVNINVLIKASPLNEEDSKAGLANLTAQMLTMGTKDRTMKQIDEKIDFIGANISASINYDFTTVSLSILKKDIETGFDILSDILINPVFQNDEIKRKKDLIKNSLKQQEEEPSFIANKAFIKEIFGNAPYSRLVEGNEDTIDNIDREDLITFYKTYYTPSNATLVIVGDLTKDELDNLLEKYFSVWCCPILQKEIKNLEPKIKGNKPIIIDKDTMQATLILGHIGISRDNPDYYAVSVMNYILGGGGFASRLTKTIRDDMGLTYYVYSLFSINKEKGLFEIFVQTKNENLKKTVMEIIKQLNKIQTDYVSDTELNDAKTYLIGSLPRKLESNHKIADFLRSVEFFRLGDDYIEKYIKHIKSLTKEDIKRVAQKYLSPNNLTTVVVGKKEKIDLPISP